MRQHGAWMALGVWLLLAGAAGAQTRPDVDPWGRYNGRTEQQGGTLRHYDAWGRYEGHSERSAGGGVMRHYDAEGRYLGRDDIDRDFRNRQPAPPPIYRPLPQPYPPRPPYGNGYGQPNVHVYIDPAPPLWQPAEPERPQPPPPRGRTPWFNDPQRARP